MLSITLLLCQILTFTTVSSKTTIHIAGLYPNHPDTNDPITVNAANLAIRHIHEKNILPNYQLDITFRDTQCSTIVGLNAFIEFITDPVKDYAAIFGGWCSVSTQVVAGIAPYHNLSIISYGATSPALANSDRYPTFVRGVPSDIYTVFGYIYFLRTHKFKRLAIISELEEIFSSMNAVLQPYLNSQNFKYYTDTIDLNDINFLDKLDAILSSLEENGYRVIIINLYEDGLVHLMCKLKSYPSLLPHLTTWITQSAYVSSWYNNSVNLTNGRCTNEEVRSRANGIIAIDSIPRLEDYTSLPNTTISGYTSSQIWDQLKDDVDNEYYAGFFAKKYTTYNIFAYDTMWTLALAFNKTLSEMSLIESRHNPDIIYNHMRNVDFTGATGRVRYFGHERYDGNVQLTEFVNGAIEFRGLLTGLPINQSNYSALDNIVYKRTNYFTIWDASMATDGIEVYSLNIVIVIFTASLSFVVACIITSSIIIILAGVFKGYKSIRLSEPLVTIAILSGNYLLVLLAITLSIDGQVLESAGLPGLCIFFCQFRYWLFSVSISLIFGGMVGKAMKYYIIAIKHKFSIGKKMRPITVLLFPLFLIIIDTIYIAFWYGFYPLRCIQTEIHSNIQSTPFYLIRECSHENSSIYFLFFGILISFKSVLVVVGLILAYHLRKIVNKQLEYSSTITWTMYNMVIYAVGYLLITRLIPNIDIKYGLASSISLLCALTTTIIIVGPLIYYMITDPHGKHSINELPNNSVLLSPVSIQQKGSESISQSMSNNSMCFTNSIQASIASPLPDNCS